MKRAIVWMCWGGTFLAEAIESARSALTIEADRFLITDEDRAQQAQQSAAFTAVIAMNPVYRNNLEKMRIVDLLPGDYDVYLYLDTDTRILGDVTLGFEKAAQHGMAMVPAPHYNLTSSRFGGFMTRVGIRPADQMVYNAGVIFFQLAPAVRQVLERWRDLAPTGARSNFFRNQPFLTLAMEQLGFVPYALSPLYNYRSMSEWAIGTIRIWHSHFPPPADVNDFKNLYPPRRFNDGVRLPVDAELFGVGKPAK
jgi:hypothetical protein